MRREKPIFLLTDFGDKDYYVAAMKARILSINPKACIVDITHEISKWNVLEGAFVLWQIMPYIPEKAIVVGVVDPGVGTERRGVVIKTDKHYYIGPDNGLLFLAASKEKIVEVLEVDADTLDGNISATFHGRDIFAPIAAYASLGKEVKRFGREIHWIELVKTPCEKIRLSYKKMKIYIIYIDGFGNLVTNVPCDLLSKWLVNASVKEKLLIKIRGKRLQLKRVATFEELGEGKIGFLCDSSGLIEIVMNREYASEKLGLKVGDILELIKIT